MIRSPKEEFEYFCVPVNSSWMEHVWRLRYDVYCVDCHFLEQANYPGRQEKDKFDPHAIHLAATNEEGKVIASVRLVQESEHGFPFEEHGGLLNADFQILPRDSMAEISRLTVHKDYRGAQGRLLAGLLRLCTIQAIRGGKKNVLATMESRLQRLLARYGYSFDPIGDAMEYYGTVIPYLMEIDVYLVRLAERRMDLLHYLIAGTGTERALPFRPMRQSGFNRQVRLDRAGRIA